MMSMDSDFSSLLVELKQKYGITDEDIQKILDCACAFANTVMDETIEDVFHGGKKKKK